MMKVRSVLDGFASGIFGGTCEHDDDDASKRIKKFRHLSSKNKARSQSPNSAQPRAILHTWSMFYRDTQ